MTATTTDRPPPLAPEIAAVLADPLSEAARLRLAALLKREGSAQLAAEIAGAAPVTDGAVCLAVLVAVSRAVHIANSANLRLLETVRDVEPDQGRYAALIRKELTESAIVAANAICEAAQCITTLDRT